MNHQWSSIYFSLYGLTHGLLVICLHTLASTFDKASTLVTLIVQSISLLEIIIAGAAIRALFKDLLLVKVAEYFNLFRFEPCGCVEFIIGHALTHFVYLVDIVDILAVPGVNVDDSVHEVTLEFNGLPSIYCLWNWHTFANANWCVLVRIDLWFDVFKDLLLELRVLCEHLKIFCLFQFYHL